MANSKSPNVANSANLDTNILFKVVVGAILTIILQLLLISQMLFKEIPPTSGWYFAWADQISDRIMYKDYFVPFPPGSVFFEGVIPRIFHDVFAAQDLVHLVYWLIFSLAIYLIAVSYSSWLIAFTASALSLAVYQVQPGNIIAGYYETMLMFLGCSVLFLIHAYRRDQIFLYVTSGLCLGAASTIKQTVWLFVLIVVITIPIDLVRHGIKSSSARNRSSLILGISLPWIVITVWNLANNNFHEMWGALLSGGGKDSTSSFTFVTIFLQSLTGLNNNFFLVLILLIIILSYQKSENSALVTLGAMTAILVLLNTSADVIFGRGGVSNGQAMVYLFQVIVLILLAAHLKISKTEFGTEAPKFGLGIFVISSLPVIAVIVGLQIPRRSVAGPVLGVDFYTWFKDGGLYISNSLILFGHLGLILPFLLFLILRPQNSFSALGKLGATDLIFVAAAQISVQIMNSFAGGPTIETWILTIPVGLILVHSLIEQWRPHISHPIFVGFVAIWLICLGPVEREKPYEWSGVTSSPLSVPRVKPDISGLGLFRIENYSAMKLELLSKEIKNLQLEETPVLYGLRNAGMATLFGTNSYPLHCTVLWWDVCPEDLAQKDEEKIKSNPPKAILWLFETQATVTANEATWRAGSSSAAGRIQKSIEEAITGGEYRIVCEFNENSLTPSVVTRLLVRND